MGKGASTQQKHRAMVDLVERKIRLRARQLYEERGSLEGFALEDWLQAESEVLKTSILAPLYRRLRNASQVSSKFDSGRSTPEPRCTDDGGGTSETLPFSSIATTS